MSRMSQILRQSLKQIVFFSLIVLIVTLSTGCPQSSGGGNPSGDGENDNGGNDNGGNGSVSSVFAPLNLWDPTYLASMGFGNSDAWEGGNPPTNPDSNVDIDAGNIIARFKSRSDWITGTGYDLSIGGSPFAMKGNDTPPYILINMNGADGITTYSKSDNVANLGMHLVLVVIKDNGTGFISKEIILSGNGTSENTYEVKHTFNFKSTTYFPANDDGKTPDWTTLGDTYNVFALITNLGASGTWLPGAMNKTNVYIVKDLNP